LTNPFLNDFLSLYFYNLRFFSPERSLIMKRLFTWGCFIAMGMLISTAAYAGAPLGGLAVAVSPDAGTIVTGGDNRVLYVMDGASLEVKQRIWMEATLVSMHFNKNGNRLLIEDTSSTIHFLDTAKWVVERQVKKATSLSAARSADLCAGRYSSKEIQIFSMNDGVEKCKVKIDHPIAAFGLNPDGTRLAVFSKFIEDKSEPVIASKDIPKDLKGLDKNIFKEKNDGKASMFYLFEVPTGKQLFSAKTFYSTRSKSTVFFDGNTVMVTNYSNINAKIGPDGKSEIFELMNSYNYGMGISPDHKWLGTGGLARGTYTTVNGLGRVEFKIPKLAGWPEYFKDFAFDAQGNAYATTSAFRLIKIKPGGKVDKAVAVY
jgi:hypothetical protein